MKKTTIASAILATFLSTTALAHTNSIGYVGDGNGGINFWYGSWHDGTTFNEAEIKIVKPDGTTSIDAFNLLSQDSPAGLLSGINYFGSDGTALIPYNINAGGGESYTWQGLNYANLPVGTYTFIYIPLGDAESTICPQASYQAGTCSGPTADWDPMDQVIRSLTINLTQNDINGDANANGILDIVEVGVGDAADAAAAAGNGPTVVSQGSSTVVGYIAVSGGVIQVVQRTRTHTMWDNMSDGTIANQMSHVTQLPDLVGRIDQMATGNNMLSMTNRRLSFDGVNFVRDMDKMGNGMTGGVTGLTVGGTRELDNGWSIGAGVGKLSTSVRDDGSADIDTTLVNLHGGRTIDQGRIDFGLTHAMNDYTSSRTIGDFANSSTTSGTDSWINVKFTGNGERVRPVLGVTRGVRKMDGYTETGDAQTARTVRSSSDWYTFGTVGAQATLTQGVNIEALHHTDGVNSLNLVVDKEIRKDTMLTVKAGRNVSDKGAANSIMLGLVKKF